MKRASNYCCSYENKKIERQAVVVFPWQPGCHMVVIEKCWFLLLYVLKTELPVNHPEINVSLTFDQIFLWNL